jgi:hypothetical protein
LASTPAPPRPGWYRDPDQVRRFRYWNGVAWTDDRRDDPPPSDIENPHPHKITVGWLVGWALGIFLIVPAILLIPTQPIPALAGLAASLVLLPPTSRLIQEKGNFQLSGGAKCILVALLLGIIGATTERRSPFEKATMQQRGTPIETGSGMYREVFAFRGNGPKKSEPFTIKGDRFKIAYNCGGSLCQAWLKKPATDSFVEIIMNSTGALTDESIFYGAGTYYIESNSIGTYAMSVQDYR